MDIKTKTIASLAEQDSRRTFYRVFKSSPIPEDEQLANLGLFVKRQELTKLLFFNDIYKRILNVHGVIMEFGVRWGPNLATLNNLRGIYEPYNHSRKIVGFDTFSGFPSISEKDGSHDIMQVGSFSVTPDYRSYLEKVLDYHESECPLNHVKKNFLIRGDAPAMLEQYLKDHPETIIALAYFDFDIYEPTKRCLELIGPYLTKGSIVGFDELNDPQFPGETVALRETLGLGNISIQRSAYSGIQSFFTVE